MSDGGERGTSERPSEPSADLGQPRPSDPGADERAFPAEEPWRRLDRRMLLVHPVHDLGRFLIPLVVVLVAGRATDSPAEFLAVLIPIVTGVVRYVTTSYRIAGDRVELRRGLLERHVLSVRVDRVRTVDLTASPVHRMLGLTTLRVGTATASTDADEKVDLDGLAVEEARALRASLLREAPVGEGEPVTMEVARFDPSWLRFAPFTSAGVALAGALLGLGSQVLSAAGWFEELQIGGEDVDSPGWAVASIVLGLLVAIALASVVLSIVGYLVTNWGFRLDHHHDAWHMRRGLLTTRETSLDDTRVAGVRIGEPLGLRLAAGARLTAIATGLRSTGEQGSGSSALLPPAPRGVVDGAARAVCGSAGPVDAVLRPHGPAAVRRRWIRALLPAVSLLALTVIGWLVAGVPAWLAVPAGLVVVAAAGLAADRSRALGHTLADGYLVARSGSLLRARDALHTDHVIGWTLRATFFQRRVGLTDLVATTAGGRQRVLVRDVPEPVAVDLATAAVPALAGQFLRPGTS